jgi:hypothetical protein
VVWQCREPVLPARDGIGSSTAAGRADLGGTVLPRAFLGYVRPQPQPARSTIRRTTGRLLTPSMPLTSSARPAPPPQPSWRIRAMMSRSGVADRPECAWLSMRSCPQRSQVTRMNQDGNAANGSSRAWSPVGSGSLP